MNSLFDNRTTAAPLCRPQRWEWPELEPGDAIETSGEVAEITRTRHTGPDGEPITINVVRYLAPDGTEKFLLSDNGRTARVLKARKIDVTETQVRRAMNLLAWDEYDVSYFDRCLNRRTTRRDFAEALDLLTRAMIEIPDRIAGEVVAK